MFLMLFYLHDIIRKNLTSSAFEPFGHKKSASGKSEALHILKPCRVKEQMRYLTYLPFAPGASDGVGTLFRQKLKLCPNRLSRRHRANPSVFLDKCVAERGCKCKIKIGFVKFFLWKAGVGKRWYLSIVKKK